MKGFIKEILADSAKLVLLIIVPIGFLGPGWRPRENAIGIGFRPEKGRGEGTNVASSEASEAKALRGSSDRYIEVLEAFREPGDSRRGGSG